MLPRIVLHNAVALDGRVDHLAPDLGLFYGLAARWHEDATLAGSDTLLAAPDGTVADGEAVPAAAPPAPGDARSLLVAPDSRGRLRCWRALLASGIWRAGVALCSLATPPGHLDYLRRSGVEAITAGEDHVDLVAALEALAARHGVGVVRVDSGGTLNGVLLRLGVVSEVSVLVHPALVGGLTPGSIFRAPDLGPDGAAIPLRLRQVESLAGDVVWLRYDVGAAS